MLRTYTMPIRQTEPYVEDLELTVTIEHDSYPTLTIGSLTFQLGSRNTEDLREIFNQFDD